MKRGVLSISSFIVEMERAGSSLSILSFIYKMKRDDLSLFVLSFTDKIKRDGGLSLFILSQTR